MRDISSHPAGSSGQLVFKMVVNQPASAAVTKRIVVE